MIYLHYLAAILATWRITELFTQDRITQRLRTKFPTYLWQCPRCMSVWAGAWCALMLILGPFTHFSLGWFHAEWLSAWLGLWPFALAWLFLARVEQVALKRLHERGQELTIRVKDGQMHYNSELTPQDSMGVLQMVMQQLVRAQAPQPTSVPGPLSDLSDTELAALKHTNGGVKLS